jgi:hypothetical protein
MEHIFLKFMNIYHASRKKISEIFQLVNACGQL